MKKRTLRIWLSGAAALLFCAVFATAFISYVQPMNDRVYDISLESLDGEEIMDTSEKWGWTVFTQEGDERTVLASDGLGCFEGLAYPGQTFYFSRVMTEELDAPTLQLDTLNRSFAVFLDDRLIYTDCPELDNRIGRLTLPMREWEIMENVTIALPKNYQGRTLTIAQSTPAEPETPRMATLAYPAHVQLYCDYAYESRLIAESFQTAVTGALGFAMATIVLIIFVWQSAQRRPDVSLLPLALALFLAMAARLYGTSYQYKYFGVLPVDPKTICLEGMCWALLAFLCKRAGRMRWVVWTPVIAYAGLLLLMLSYLRPWLSTALMPFESISTEASLYTAAGLIRTLTLTAIIVLGWVFWRKESAFYRCFMPAATAVVALYTTVRMLLPVVVTPAGSLATQLSAMLGHHSLHVSWGILTVALMVTVKQFISSEIEFYTEQRLGAELAEMSRQQYENLRAHNEEIMMLRHDMDKHFAYLRQTATDEKTAGYLDELIGRSEKIRPVLQSGNETLDLIIASRLNMAAEAGIRVEILRAEAPRTLPMADADLCSLIMNLMDNALNAARTCGAGDAYIRLDLHMKNNFFLFICENAAAANSSRTEKNETVPKHGLGLKIVDQIVDRYGHLLQTEQGAGFYKISLAIQLDQSSR